jgi:hypothetical protein
MKFEYLEVWAFDNTARRLTVHNALDLAWGIHSCSAFFTRILVAVSSVCWVWMPGIILGKNLRCLCHFIAIGCLIYESYPFSSLLASFSVAATTFARQHTDSSAQEIY